MTLPAYLSAFAQRDAWLSCLLLFAVDFILLSFTLWAIKLNKSSLSLNRILTLTVGKVGSKIIFFISFVFFLTRLLCQLSQSLELFSSVLTISTNWIAYTVPIFAFAFYSINKGFRNIARMTELLFVPIALAAILLVALSFPEVETLNLLPVLEYGFRPVAYSSLCNGFWFSDYLFLALLLDRIQVKKRLFLSPLVSFGSCAILTTALVVSFTGIFGNISWMQDIAFAKISQFVITDTSKGRIEWIALVLWLFSVFIKITVTLYCSSSSLATFLNVKGKNRVNYMGLVIAALSLVIPIIMPFQQAVNHYLVVGFGKYIIYIFTILLPLCLPLLSFLATRRYRRIPKKLLCSYPLFGNTYDISVSTVKLSDTVVCKADCTAENLSEP